MKRTIVLFSLILTALVAAESCKHSPLDIVLEEDTPLTPVDTSGGGDTTLITSDCDPDTVYFENDIYPIFIGNCAVSGCHDVESHKEGIILSTYADIMDADILDISDPWDSELIEVVTETDPDDRMPEPPLPPLSADQIALLIKWQQQGALNNACTDCDTSAVTYSSTIMPIMNAYCNGCHDHSTPASGIDLTVYVGTGAIEGVSDVAADGRLVNAINFMTGYAAMPQGGTQLPDCLIEQISNWVDAGYPND